MLSKAGIAIFIFGNKRSKDGIIIDSNGMIEEFEICMQSNVIPIPIGLTGFVSKKLWDRVTSNLDYYYPENKDLHEAIIELGKEGISKDEIITNTLKAISILQKI